MISDKPTYTINGNTFENSNAFNKKGGLIYYD
jgi:hypothetical protein